MFKFVIVAGVILSKVLSGNYCFDVFGNGVKMSFADKTFNISANIFGDRVSCEGESYSISGDEIILSNDPNDCVNSYLSSQGGCSIPPNLVLVGDNIVVTDTDIGNITIKKC